MRWGQTPNRSGETAICLLKPRGLAGHESCPVSQQVVQANLLHSQQGVTDMLTWIITSGLIAGLSAAALELFSDAQDSSADDPQLQPASRSNPRAASRRWASMTDAEIQALLDEFNG